MSFSSRMKAAVLAGLVFALIALTAASARPDQQAGNGGTLVVGMARGDPDTLDPSVERTFDPVEIYKAMCLRLYDYDTSMRLVSELAVGLPTISKDRLTYLIPLRHGVRFNDGTPFNAQAVVTTIERDLTIPGGTRVSDLAPIAAISARSNYTVAIHLRSRYWPLTRVLASADGVIMSPTQLAKLGANFGSNPVCVGPFMFAGRVVGDSVTVTKSPYYYDRKDVHLDKIVFKSEPDAAAAVAALKAGDLQALDSISPTDLPAVQGTRSLHLLQTKSLGFESIFVNVGNTHGVGKLPYGPVSTQLGSSPELRHAFEEAIDRNTLSRVVFGRDVQPGCTPFAPTSPGFDPSIHCTPFNVAAAKKLVAASGIVSPTVHLLTSNQSALLRLAQFIQVEEAVVGINVVIEPADTATANTRAATGNFDAYLGGFSGSPDTDRNIFQFVATSGSFNWSGYSNPRVDLILAKARMAMKKKAIATLYHAALQIILADRPVIYLYHPIVYAAVAANVKGVQLPFDTLLRVASARYK